MTAHTPAPPKPNAIENSLTLRQQVKLYTLIAIMVACWAGNFIVGKVALKEWAPFPLAAVRVTLAALILLGIFALSRRGARNPADGPGTGVLSTAFARRDWWKWAELGLYGVALNQVFFVLGLNYTTVAHSALIISLGPILVLVIARLKGLEAFTAEKIIGMVISFAGVTFLVLEHGLSFHTGTLRGDLLTFLGSFSFALYTVASKEVATRYTSLEMNTFSFLAGALLILPIGIPTLIGFNWARITWRGWAGLIYMSVFASVVAYLIFYYALKFISASRVVAFSYLHPVLATLGGVILLGEPVTHHLIVGGSLVLVGVYLAERNHR